MNSFAIVSSTDAIGDVSIAQLHEYTDCVITSVRQAGKLIPPILVMHVSQRVATLVGVEHTGVVRHNHSSSPELLSYYEIWLVGKANFSDYVLALQGIIDDIQVSDGTTASSGLN